MSDDGSKPNKCSEPVFKDDALMEYCNFERTGWDFINELNALLVKYNVTVRDATFSKREVSGDETETTYATGKYSPCCDELLRVQSSKRDSLGDVDHVTNWYECSKCGKACD